MTSNRKLLLFGLVLLPLIFPGDLGAAATFAYADSRIILTAEFSTSQSATLNLFNLTDYVVAFRAQDLLIIAQGNILHLGQVIIRDHPKGDEGPYMGSTLIKPWTFAGLGILGTFPEPARIDQVIAILGGKRLSLSRTESAEFEELAARVESVDLKKRDGAQILESAGISR